MNPTQLTAEFNRKSLRHSQFQEAIEKKAGREGAIYVASTGKEFSLFEMLVLITIAGVGFSLITKLGLVGGFLTFNLAILLTWIIPIYSGKPASIRLLTQIIWGMLMPIFCLLSDPFLFAHMKYGVPTSFAESIALPTYVLHLLLFCVLGGSFLLRPESIGQFNAFVAGILVAGSLLFFTIGLVLIPHTLVGALAGVGFLGLAPWITGIVLARTSAMHRRWAIARSAKGSRFLWLVGLILPIWIWIRLFMWAKDGVFQDFYGRVLLAFGN